MSSLYLCERGEERRGELLAGWCVPLPGGTQMAPESSACSQSVADSQSQALHSLLSLTQACGLTVVSHVQT